MNNSNEAKNRTLQLERILNAPIKLVWEAWTKPEHIAQWWGPKGMETTVIEHNFTVGGSWKYAMKMPDGNQFIADGIYQEIEKPHKIITSANFKPMTVGVELRIVLEAQDDKTLFHFSVLHETEEYCKQQEQMGFMNGWGSVFNRLEEFLKEALA